MYSWQHLNIVIFQFQASIRMNGLDFIQCRLDRRIDITAIYCKYHLPCTNSKLNEYLNWEHCIFYGKFNDGFTILLQ